MQLSYLSHDTKKSLFLSSITFSFHTKQDIQTKHFIAGHELKKKKIPFLKHSASIKHSRSAF